MAWKRPSLQYNWLLELVARPATDECIIWPFRKDRDGYGRIAPPVQLYGNKTFGAHRLVFRLVNGKWPEPEALHSCDTPSCVNPRHISEGTNAENQRQKAERGRSLRGVQQHSAKLTPTNVEEIRKRYKVRQWGDVERMAKDFGVSRRVVRLVAQGKLWKCA